GVNFFDTSDVYGFEGDGHSEKLLGRLKRERREPILIATKVGRRITPHVASGYNHANLSACIDQSLARLGVEQIDLVQLHCPPYEVYYRP
ncbi:MAG TPA: aldo/keto reductase, partial [Anaerolineales bacterium]|nr:aldo/keto reductase [Anaerolineales bacterium]